MVESQNLDLWLAIPVVKNLFYSNLQLFYAFRANILSKCSALIIKVSTVSSLAEEI